jgi:hypothetical protein
MKKIKDFKSAKELKPCFSCEKLFKDVCSIKIVTSDTTHRYKTSKRPWINHYSLKLCPKCFKEFEKKIVNIVI